MQYAKDSFYMTLMGRLESLNPTQTVTLNGATRPAIVVAENEPVTPLVPLPDCFYIEWGASTAVPGQTGSRVLMEMDCVISYHTLGTVESGVDRGRTLGAWDMELLSMLQPPSTPKQDYTQAPPVFLGTNVFWTGPVFGDVEGGETVKTESLPHETEGVRLSRSVTVKVFFSPEANLL
jgi:hypothetical protein